MSDITDINAYRERKKYDEMRLLTVKAIETIWHTLGSIDPSGSSDLPQFADVGDALQKLETLKNMAIRMGSREDLLRIKYAQKILVAYRQKHITLNELDELMPTLLQEISL